MAAGSILIVDHQSQILNVSKSALTRYCYDVLTACSGEAALSILETRRHVDLVLSEAVFPSGMSGSVLVGKVKKSYPSTAVMLMAAYTEQPLDPTVALLRKPFTSTALVQRVEQAIVESRLIAQGLQKTFEANFALKSELQSAASAVRENLVLSRQKRIERFCTRIREAGAVAPTVLVVEDDPVFRYAVCCFLSRLGFVVMEACDGQEALEMTRDNRGRIDALVTDIEMPRLNGLELAKSLSIQRPQTRIVCATGEECDVPYLILRKPFDLDDLLATLVTVLSQA